jgi:GcrA cell cycle regulator
MQSTDWPREHSDALREYFGRGMSFSQIAGAINARFNTAYSRSAVLGRATRIGLAGAGRADQRTTSPSEADQTGVHKQRERHAAMLMRPRPVFEPAKPLKLRCVEIVPRHVSLLDLEPDDCRYPYGGDEDGVSITFCAHPRQPDSSYCTAHFDLARGPGTASERAADAFLLWLLERHQSRTESPPRATGKHSRRADAQSE